MKFAICIQELNSKRGKQDRCENLARFRSRCYSHLSRYGWICPGACSDSDTKEKSLQLTQFLILFNWGTALLFVCECQKSDRLLVGMTGWWKCTVSVFFSCPGQLNNWYCLSVGRSEPTNNQMRQWLQLLQWLQWIQRHRFKFGFKLSAI